MQAFLSKITLWLLMVMVLSAQTSAFAMHNCNTSHASSPEEHASHMQKTDNKTSLADHSHHHQAHYPQESQTLAKPEGNMSSEHAKHMASMNETISESDNASMSDMDCCGADCSCPTASCSSVTAFNDYPSFSLALNSDKAFGLTQVALHGIFSSLFKPPIQS
ncbi:hypothetical protein DXX93_12280 [Thalassotalea euphylliae]|uniref:CopL family metal-binding regulatory protein n=2 Tax=Thalassotalea euphylliae TaxID=1655234 RepID=A0A3E0TSF4_9GAMM|nr:hypothetical protein DXX93_12280 [Thalassotalea euphylliae]